MSSNVHADTVIAAGLAVPLLLFGQISIDKGAIERCYDEDYRMAVSSARVRR